MEIAASVGGLLRRREHRRGGGRFRMEIEMDRGSPAFPRGPGYGFAAAVREPLVRLQRPKFDFERWNWDYFAWPHDRLDANLEMRDSDPEATLEADRKASESFLNQSMLQLERYAMNQNTQDRRAVTWPHEQFSANIKMRDSDPEVTLEADRPSSEGYLKWSTLQLDGHGIEQYTPEQNDIILPHNQHGAIQGAKDCNQKGTLDADQKESKSLMSRTRLQLKRREMDQDQHMQEQPKLRTLDGSQKAGESMLSRSRLQLKRPKLTQDQHTQEQQKEPEVRTLDVSQKASKNLFSRSRLKPNRREMARDKHMPELQKEPELRTSLLLNGKPIGHRSKGPRRCAVSNGILDHGRAMQGSWAF